MKILLISLSILVAILLAWFFLSQGTPIANYPPKNDRVIAFGDSLVEGVGSTRGNDFVSQLAKKIGRPIVNLGVSGNTTADGVARVNEALAQDAGIVILLLGGNDTLRRVPEATTRENLITLITAFQERGAVVVLLGVRGGIIGSARADMYEAISTEYGTLYIPDVLQGIILKPELMYDGIHPNDAGYSIITERIHSHFIEHNLLAKR